MSGMRDRFRTQVRQEVKDLALAQLAAGGPQALSINAIARELGVSGPALYRYFASRDALLTELIVDAYDDLGAATAAAAPELSGTADAYRAWARAQPHRYRLLFTAPLPGYDAHGPDLVAAAQRAMSSLLAVVAADTPAADPELSAQLAAWARARGDAGTEPAVAVGAVTLWSRLHGFVSLEIEGNFASMGVDPDLLFEREKRSVAAGQ